VAAKIGPVIFVSGRDSVDLREESARHGDILQLDFEDSYQNLTLKMMGLIIFVLPFNIFFFIISGLYRYFIEQSGVREIIVINDDTIVNATSLLEVLNAPKVWAHPSDFLFTYIRTSQFIEYSKFKVSHRKGFTSLPPSPISLVALVCFRGDLPSQVLSSVCSGIRYLVANISSRNLKIYLSFTL
jgi:hypothetical protein